MLLSAKDRAELASREYTCVPSVLEGLVIVEKVPEELLAAEKLDGKSKE